MIKHYLTYLIGILFINGAGFLLIPVYATHLSPAEYGVLEIIYNCVDVFNIIFSAGIGIASLSIYSKETDEQQKNHVISTAIITSFCIATVGCVLFFLVSDILDSYFFGGKVHLNLFRIAGLYMLSQILCAVPMSFLQARMDSKKFICISSLQSLTIMSMNIFAVTYLNWRIEGILLSNLIGSSLFAMGLNIWTLRTVGYTFEANYLWRLMSFGLPFIPGGLFLFVMSTADRFFLQKFTDSASVGVYALGYKLGTIAAMFVLGPFLRIWGPYMFKLDREADCKDRIGQFFMYLLLAYTTAALAIALFSPEVIRVISSQGYWQASGIVPYVLFAYFCWTAAAFFDSGFYITEKTYFKPFILGITAAVIIGLYGYLIPVYGILGAAYGASAGYLLYSILTYYVSQRIYPVRYPLGKLAIIVSGAGILYFLGTFIHTGYTLGNIAFKMMFLISYPLIMIWLGIIGKPDFMMAKCQITSFLTQFKPGSAEQI